MMAYTKNNDLEKKTAYVHRPIYTVSQLTAEIKSLLEETYPMVWITGEISNFSQPASGHYYFALKDPSAQIQAVMFRGQNRRLVFSPEDGMQITGIGRISIYEPRGTYQIILEHMEPKGVGALQVAFEQLKTRLSQEGIFDADRKKPIPFLPEKIAVVTSSTGAVIHDIIRIIQRRFPGIPLVIAPVAVQGNDAVRQITEAIRLVNQMPDPADVLILARGGGSLEDLQAFNSEEVARAIFSSEIPVVSAIGHETDFTIADFVADLRAPTPSAAAELVSPDQSVLLRQYGSLALRLKNSMAQQMGRWRQQLAQLERRLRNPGKRIEDFRIRLDDVTARLQRSMETLLQQQQRLVGFLAHRLVACSPRKQVDQLKVVLEQYNITIQKYILEEFYLKTMELQALEGKLQVLNPRSILQRGYSITRTVPQKRVVRSSADVRNDQELEILLAKGAITCRVKDILLHDEKNI
ncbi:MAG: exodeoxyribonuclease VII large subunit [Thermodesulfobacteriota bacterium]